MRRILSISGSRAFVVFVACVTASVGQTGSTATSNPTDADLVREILAGDDDAVKRAGSSGNKEYIPILKQLENDAKFRNAGGRMALAKLGDANEQQVIWCDIWAGTSHRWEGYSLPTFEYIGGWYGIQASVHFLLPVAQRNWEKMRRREKPTDIVPPPAPAYFAMVALSKLVPSAPAKIKVGEGSILTSTWDARQNLEDLRPYIAQWQAWISSHKEELNKLEPTGEAVDFSPQACKNGKPRESHP